MQVISALSEHTVPKLQVKTWQMLMEFSFVRYHLQSCLHWLAVESVLETGSCPTVA